MSGTYARELPDVSIQRRPGALPPSAARASSTVLTLRSADAWRSSSAPPMLRRRRRLHELPLVLPVRSRCGQQVKGYVVEADGVLLFCAHRPRYRAVAQRVRDGVGSVQEACCSDLTARPRRGGPSEWTTGPRSSRRTWTPEEACAPIREAGTRDLLMPAAGARSDREKQGALQRPPRERRIHRSTIKQRHADDRAGIAVSGRRRLRLGFVEPIAKPSARACGSSLLPTAGPSAALRRRVFFLEHPCRPTGFFL